MTFLPGYETAELELARQHHAELIRDVAAHRAAAPPDATTRAPSETSARGGTLAQIATWLRALSTADRRPARATLK